MSNILVTGATGHFGKAAIDFLLQKGVSPNSISALVRDESKAGDLKNKGITLKKGDYDDYPSLVAAFKGTDKLLFVSGNDIQNRDKQQKDVVKAAVEAGVKQIMYTSFIRKNETESSPIAFLAKAHIETENEIKNSGIDFTIFKNAVYADMLPMFLGEKVFDTGVFLPAGEGKVSFTTRADMAEAAANILIGEGHKNKEYILANQVNYSFQDVADILSDLSGKKIAYFSPAAEIYSETLLKAGVPADYVGMFAAFSEGFKQSEFETHKSDLEMLLGRTPTSLKSYFQTVYGNTN